MHLTTCNHEPPLDPLVGFVYRSSVNLQNFSFSLLASDNIKLVISIARDEFHRMNQVIKVFEIPEMPRIKAIPIKIFPNMALYTVVYSEALKLVYPPVNFNFIYGCNAQSDHILLKGNVFLGNVNSIKEWRNLMFVYRIENYQPPYDREAILALIKLSPTKIAISLADNLKVSFEEKLKKLNLEFNYEFGTYVGFSELIISLFHIDQISLLDELSKTGLVKHIEILENRYRMGSLP